MRIILILVAAGLVGSTAISILTSFMTGGPANDAAKVGKMYRDDPKMAIALTEQASIACVPRLKEVQSDKVRELLAQTFTLVIQSSHGVPRDEVNEKISRNVQAALRQASKSDVILIDEIVSASAEAKSDVVQCVLRRVASS